MNSQLILSPNPLLFTVSQSVNKSKLSSKETKDIIAALRKTAIGKRENATKPIMVGLAAIQIGTAKRIILVDTYADGKGKVTKLTCYINPEIIKKSQTENEWYEGCWSVKNICGIVNRATNIIIKALDENGKEIIEQHSGYVARIFQHEIDHLDGKLFVDHISNKENLHLVKDDEFEEYRNREAWRSWPHKANMG